MLGIIRVLVEWVGFVFRVLVVVLSGKGYSEFRFRGEGKWYGLVIGFVYFYNIFKLFVYIFVLLVVDGWF